MLCATCALLIASAAAQGGQRDQRGNPTQTLTPQTPAPYQYGKRKGPRAIAVVRWDADAKDRAVPLLLPVAILTDGKFYDAGIYKAAPAPMPLLVGTVYEAQDKGEILGYFTITGQVQSRAKLNWFAIGDWLSATPPMDKFAANAVSHVEVVNGKLGDQPEATGGDQNDDRDLNKKKTTVYDENGKPMPEGTTASPAAPMGGAGNTQPRVAKTAGTQKTDTKPTDKKTSDDPDRPTITRGSTSSKTDSSQTPNQTQTSGDATTNKPSTPTDASGTPDHSHDTIIVPDKDPNRPEIRRGKPATQSVAGGLPQKVEAADRPIIRRTPGQTTDPDKQPMLPVPPRVLARGPLLGESNDAPALLRKRTYEVASVSDANVDPPTTFRYKMTTDEKDDLQAKMDLLAQNEVDNYLKSIGRARPDAAVAVPAKSKAPLRKTAKTVKPKEEPPRKSLFAESQFEVMDLDHRNDATLIFSGRERIEPKDSPSAAPQDVYVLYVAHVDYQGNPRGIFRSVTVNDRLDVTPKLELIDAIDAQGNSLGQLLFRRVTGDGAEFAIFKVNFDGMTEIFHGGTAD